MQLPALVLEEKMCSGVKSSGEKALIAERSTLQLKLKFSIQCTDISNQWSSSASVCLLKYTAFVRIKLRMEFSPFLHQNSLAAGEVQRKAGLISVSHQNQLTR